MCAMSWRRAAADRGRDREITPGAGWMGRRERAPFEEELSILRLPRSADVCESSRGPRGRAGASSGHLFRVGTGGDLDLDAQDQWVDGERLHSRSQNRQALA